MSLQSVKEFFSIRAPEIEIIETVESSATVQLAACAHAVEPEQIAKTIGVRAGETIALIVMAGTARLDNRKFRSHFDAKPRMLGADDVLELTGHPVGGVCPFGLARPVPVFCDISLKNYAEVIPAAGAA